MLADVSVKVKALSNPCDSFALTLAPLPLQKKQAGKQNEVSQSLGYLCGGPDNHGYNTHEVFTGVPVISGNYRIYPKP